MQTPISRIRRHKRHFQLLELMVAAFILLICIAPTMRIFTSIYMSQQTIIRENQRDHLAHLIHAKFTEQLYKRIIPLPEVKQSHPIPFSDPEITALLQKFAYDFSGEFTLLKAPAQGQEKPIKSLGKLVIKMKDTLYKPPKQLEQKEIENQDPSITFYDYYVYIDSGKIDGKKADPEKQNPPENQNEEDEDDGDEDDGNEDDSDEDDGDEDDDDDQTAVQKKTVIQTRPPTRKGNKPLNGKQR